LLAPQDAPFQAGGVDRVVRRVIAGQKVHVRAGFLRHVPAEGPVAANLELAVVLVQRVDVVPEVSAVALAVKLREPPEVGIPRRPGHVSDARFAPEGLQRAPAVIPVGPPTVAVDPHAVDAVLVAKLFELGDQQLIDVRPEYGRAAFVGIAVRVAASPARMMPDRGVVQHAGIVHVQRHAHLGGDAPPYPQLVPHEPAGRVPHLRGIAGNARMPLAVHLDIVRANHLYNPPHHLRRDVPADLGAAFRHVLVEMDPQKALRAPQPPGHLALSLGHVGSFLTRADSVLKAYHRRNASPVKRDGGGIARTPRRGIPACGRTVSTARWLQDQG